MRSGIRMAAVTMMVFSVAVSVSGSTGEDYAALKDKVARGEALTPAEDGVWKAEYPAVSPDMLQDLGLDEGPGRDRTGGPDDFGYTWIDSDEEGGPEFNWIEINRRVRGIPFRDDESKGPFELGFEFPFYGENRTEFNICSNGYITFGNSYNSWWHFLRSMTDRWRPYNVIAPLWLDLHPRGWGKYIFFWSNNADSAIVEWDNIPAYHWRVYQGHGPKKFQVILTADGSITFQYYDGNRPTRWGVVGIKNSDGSSGLSVVANRSYLHTGLAVSIRPPDWEEEEEELPPLPDEYVVEGYTGVYVPYDYRTIQEAIDNVADGDTIVVTPGAYLENINFNGRPVVLGSMFLLTGDTNFVAQTVIDADGQGDVVLFESGEGAGSKLVGLTLTNGGNDGHGVKILNSSPDIAFCRIQGNNATNGAGVWCSNANPLISNTIIYGNNASHRGGALFLWESSPTLVNCTINGNSSSEGAGIYCRQDVNLTVVNSIIWGNSAVEVCFAEDNTPNSLTVSYSDLKGGADGVQTGGNGDVNWGDGNLDSDPMFSDPTGGDFVLSLHSPCYNTGDPNSELDPDGTTIEMGAMFRPAYTGRLYNVPGDYQTIQGAIDVAMETDTVLVQPGIYSENIRFEGEDIVVGSLFLTTGDLAYVAATVIDGGGSGDVVSINSGANQFTQLCGFTIRNGAGTTAGHGINITDASPSVSYCIITGNISNNGGGIRCVNGSPLLAHCVITNNTARYWGAALYLSNASPLVNSCTISGNASLSNDIGIFCSNGSAPTVINSIMWDNGADEIYFDANYAACAVTVSYSDVRGGTSRIETNGNGDINWGDGNINQEPLFVNYATRNLKLRHASPCVDTGDPDSPLDPDGTTIEMGAYYTPLHVPTTLHVPDEYTSVQSAIDAAGELDTVLVQPGVYHESIHFNGLDVIVASLFIIDGDREHIFETVIDAGQNGNVVFFNASESRASQVCGFTLRNGRGTTTGSGVRIVNANPTISYCVVTGNLTHNGGGLFCSNAAPALDHLLIYGNRARYYGSALFLTDSNPVISNCTIVDNELNAVDAGIHCLQGSHPVMVNSILRDNGDYEVLFRSTGAANSLTVGYSNILGGQDGMLTNNNGSLTWGDGNLDADPLFANANAGDYRLTWENFPTTDETMSPAIDTGDPASALDADGTRADMGVWFFDQVEAGAGRGLMAMNGGAMPVQFKIEAAWPNPFNASANVKYGLPSAAVVTLTLHDAAGRRVATLAEGFQAAGFHTVPLNGQFIPTGAYFLRLNAGGTNSMSRIVLMK